MNAFRSRPRSPPPPRSRSPSHERHLLHRDIDRVLRHRRGLRIFLREGALNPTHPGSPMENILIGLIALACLAYLVVAVLRPEKF